MRESISIEDFHFLALTALAADHHLKIKKAYLTELESAITMVYSVAIMVTVALATRKQINPYLAALKSTATIIL